MKTSNSVLSSLKTKAGRAYVMGATTATAMCYPTTVFAASSDSSGIQSGAISIATLLVTVFALVGLYYLLPSAYKVFTAFKEGRGDDIHDSAKGVIVGLALIFFRVFAWPSISELISQAL